jgi:death-on-curing protein
MKYLTFEEIIAIHDYAIREFGGSPEVGSVARLEAVVASPRQTMFGQELYPDLFSKAAILIFLLIKDHPFVDGNKRTGLFGLFEFLERNDCTVVAPNDELYQFTLDIATSKLDKEQIEKWLRAHTIPAPRGD